MNKRNFIHTIGAILLAATFILAGCSSDDEKTERTSVIDQVADTFAQNLVASINQSRTEAPFVAQTIASDEVIAETEGIVDMVTLGSVIYAVHSGGLTVYDLADNSQRVVATAQPLSAVTAHAGNIYVGGDKLYILNGENLEPADLELSAPVTSLGSFDLRLMVGTESGLHSRSPFGDEVLMEDVCVSAMTRRNDELWIGTRGQGLYSWDGADFRKRYLVRDPSLFDTVNSLDFGHYHLYVGTDVGMYVFDGGSWETFTTENGLPGDAVRAVDATDWMVYIATDGGVISYFNGEFYPVKKLADVMVRSLAVIDNKIIFGTEDAGILMKSGPMVKTLIEPQQPADSTQSPIFSVSF